MRLKLTIQKKTLIELTTEIARRSTLSSQKTRREKNTANHKRCCKNSVNMYSKQRPLIQTEVRSPSWCPPSLPVRCPQLEVATLYFSRTRGILHKHKPTDRNQPQTPVIVESMGLPGDIRLAPRTTTATVHPQEAANYGDLKLVGSTPSTSFLEACGSTLRHTLSAYPGTLGPLSHCGGADRAEGVHLPPTQ